MRFSQDKTTVSNKRTQNLIAVNGDGHFAQESKGSKLSHWR